MKLEFRNSLLGLCLLLAVISLAFNACSNKTQEETALATSSDLKMEAADRADGEMVQIGVIKDGEFSFTVSEDVLAEAYSYNLEQNLDESGVLEEARVDVPANEEEGETSYLVLTGTYGEEGSASLSADVTMQEVEGAEGILAVVISVRPVYAGLCYRVGCNNCEQLPIYPNRTCRCLPAGVFCDYYPDPTIIWIW